MLTQSTRGICIKKQSLPSRYDLLVVALFIFVCACTHSCAMGIVGQKSFVALINQNEAIVFWSHNEKQRVTGADNNARKT